MQTTEVSTNNLRTCGDKFKIPYSEREKLRPTNVSETVFAIVRYAHAHAAEGMTGAEVPEFFFRPHWKGGRENIGVELSECLTHLGFNVRRRWRKTRAGKKHICYLHLSW